MNDDLETRLRVALSGTLPDAPDGLRRQLDGLDEPAGAHRTRRWRSWLVPLAATVLLVGIALAGIVTLGAPGPAPSDGPAPASPAAVTSTPASAAPELTPPALPGSMTVSEFLAASERGELGDRPIVVRGYWTFRAMLHSCSAPDEPPGDLEIRCHDGEFGITERPEPIGTLEPDGRWIPTAGAALTPYIDETRHPAIARALFTLPGGNGQPHAPVPIVVRGHVNDPRAEDCQPAAKERCRARLVIDELVEFDPDAVPTPGVTAPPSPFPFDDPPPAPFGADECSGNVPYSFVGWTTLGELELDRGDPGTIVYAMVTRDATDLQGQGGRFARWICFAHEGDDTAISFATIP
jgi:hypothetical protein